MLAKDQKFLFLCSVRLCLVAIAPPRKSSALTSRDEDKRTARTTSLFRRRRRRRSRDRKGQESKRQINSLYFRRHHRYDVKFGGTDQWWMRWRCCCSRPGQPGSCSCSAPKKQ
uniref:Putative secreted protein n=1 Tax=Anopheles darlingi TaxID=43151 RepID=A0A2M4DDE8_ANODA